MAMTQLLIIGGSDAGISAALRARELDPTIDITTVLCDSFPNFSICGLPFYLSGEVPDWRNLAHRTAEEITRKGIHLLMNHTAQIIDPVNKTVRVVKIFELAVARTGLSDAEAKSAGFEPVTIEIETWDHKVYYPGAHKLQIRVTGDLHSGRLLGAQMLGHYQGEIAKRIDIFATALFHGTRIDELNDFDLNYTPPLSSPWDPVQMAAQAWVKAQWQQSNPIPTRVSASTARSPALYWGN